jgi:hypothetical protein
LIMRRHSMLEALARRGHHATSWFIDSVFVYRPRWLHQAAGDKCRRAMGRCHAAPQHVCILSDERGCACWRCLFACPAARWQCAYCTLQSVAHRIIPS